MFKNLLENLKDIFAADPYAKGSDEQQIQSIVDVWDEDEDIDSFFRSI